MQMLAASREQIRRAHGEFVAGDVPADPPLLVMTPTSTDDSLAPAGRHVVTVWTQWQPRMLRDGGWDDIREQQTQLLVDGVERVAPGFASSVLATHLQTPADLERELDLRGGNVMHLDMTLDAMFALRPLPEWSGYRGPAGVYLCGASTHPGGGVSGASGRNAAAVVLAGPATAAAMTPRWLWGLVAAVIALEIPYPLVHGHARNVLTIATVARLRGDVTGACLVLVRPLGGSRGWSSSHCSASPPR